MLYRLCPLVFDVTHAMEGVDVSLHSASMLTLVTLLHLITAVLHDKKVVNR